MKNKARRIVVLCTAIAMTISLAACGKKNEPKNMPGLMFG